MALQQPTEPQPQGDQPFPLAVMAVRLAVGLAVSPQIALPAFQQRQRHLSWILDGALFAPVNEGQQPFPVAFPCPRAFSLCGQCIEVRVQLLA
ncbi:hypothetical protein Xenpb_03808 [Xenorhabdus sp. PB62.4]|nr:hypothetical protein [Xenorhabdus sp. PB62.4]